MDFPGCKIPLEMAGKFPDICEWSQCPGGHGNKSQTSRSPRHGFLSRAEADLDTSGQDPSCVRANEEGRQFQWIVHRFHVSTLALQEELRRRTRHSFVEHSASQSFISRRVRRRMQSRSPPRDLVQK